MGYFFWIQPWKFLLPLNTETVHLAHIKSFDRVNASIMWHKVSIQTLPLLPSTICFTLASTENTTHFGTGLDQSVSCLAYDCQFNYTSGWRFMSINWLKNYHTKIKTANLTCLSHNKTGLFSLCNGERDILLQYVHCGLWDWSSCSGSCYKVKNLISLSFDTIAKQTICSELDNQSVPTK